MNIILGDSNAEQIRTRHTVLELDRFVFGEEVEDSAYCVIERLSLGDFETNAERMELHAAMIADYRGRRWQECSSKIECLHGSWGGEMDTFYDELLKRLEQFEQQPPTDTWDYRLKKTLDILPEV